MSSDLVKRLRSAGLAYGMGKLPLDAAEKIEALEGEVEQVSALLRASRSDAAQCIRERGAANARAERLHEALAPFAAIKADDGDTFDTWGDQVVIRCEITVRDLRKAREALAQKAAGVAALEVAGAGLSPASGQAPAADPDVCVWTQYIRGAEPACNPSKTLYMGEAGEPCPICSKPIKFNQEPAR